MAQVKTSYTLSKIPTISKSTDGLAWTISSSGQMTLQSDSVEVQEEDLAYL